MRNKRAFSKNFEDNFLQRKRMGGEFRRRGGPGGQN